MNPDTTKRPEEIIAMSRQAGKTELVAIGLGMLDPQAVARVSLLCRFYTGQGWYPFPEDGIAHRAQVEIEQAMATRIIEALAPVVDYARQALIELAERIVTLFADFDILLAHDLIGQALSVSDPVKPTVHPKRRLIHMKPQTTYTTIGIQPKTVFYAHKRKGKR